MINNNILHELSTNLLGKDCVLDQLVIFFSCPGNDMQMLHSDVPQWFDQKIILPPTLVAVQIPIGEFSENSGATRIVPGTHASLEAIPNITKEVNLNIVTPQLNPGSCLIRDCRTWHRASINKSNRKRIMFLMLYTKKWNSGMVKVSKDLYFNINSNKRHLLSI